MGLALKVALRDLAWASRLKLGLGLRVCPGA